jgi:hypothetical protein
MSTQILPSLFRTTLAQALNVNGNDTEIYVTGLTTLTGESVTFSNFSPFTRGILTIDPDNTNGSQPELVSFTGVDSSGTGFTGALRGLSATGDTQISANQVYHPVGTPVIIGWGGYNVEDLITYVGTLFSGAAGNSSVTNAGVIKSTGTFGLATSPRARHAYISQQTTGTMYLIVNPISLPTTSGVVSIAQTTTAIYTAPVTHPRIDLLTYNITAASLEYRTGVEASSPSAPTPINGDVVLCSIYHRVGETKILEQDDSSNGYIQAWFEPMVFSSTSQLNSSGTTFGADQSQTTENSSQAAGEANTTGKPYLVAQSFVPTVSAIQGAALWKAADTGTFTGTVKISLQADSSGSPGGSDLASYTISNAVWVDITAAEEFEVGFSTPYTSLAVGAQYWIVVTTSTTDTSNHINIGINTGGGYAGTLKYNNTNDGWVTVSTSQAYFKTICGVVSKTVVTDSKGLVSTHNSRYALLAATYPDTTVSSTGIVDSLAVPGGLLGITGGIRVKIYFVIAADVSSNSATFQININGTTIASQGAGVQSGATTVSQLYLEAKMVNLASASSQVIYIDTLVTSTGNKLIYPLGGINTASLDTAEPLQISINVSGYTCSNPGTNDYVKYWGMLVEKIA